MIVLLATVLAASIAMAALLRCPVPVAAPTAFFTIILVIFGFGAVDLLFVGWVVAYGLVIIGAGVGLVLQWRRRGLKETLRWAFSPVVVVYLSMLGVFGIVSRDLRFSHWDEFSHWGRVVAAMASGDALPPFLSTDLLFSSYPPALPVWEYFLVNGRHDFVEANVFLAYHALTLALFLPFAARLRLRRPRHLVFFAAVSSLLMTTFFTLDSILIDPVLAMTFGYCVALALLGSLDSGSIWRHLGPALAVLALLKDAGVLFALISIAVLIVRVGIRERLPLRSRRLSRLPASAVYGVLGLACVLLPIVIWHVILAATDTPSAFGAGSSLGSALAPLINQGDIWRIQTTNSFVDAMSTQPITTSPVPLVFWAWFALALVLLVAVDFVRAWVVGDEHASPVTRLPATSTLLIGALVYIASIWLTYMTKFSEYEATHLASFVRYVQVYWLAVMFACIAVMLWALGSKTVQDRSTRSDAIRILAACFLALLISLSQVASLAGILHRQQVASASAARAPYDATAVVAAQAGIAAGDHVWILDQYATGLGYWVLSYELVDTHTAGWSVGPPADENDIWTRDLTIDDWSDELAAFDYLVVHHTEPIVAERYGELFEEPADLLDHSVFEVRTSGSGHIQLVAVDLS